MGAKKYGLPTPAKFCKRLPVEYTVTCVCKKRCNVRCKCRWKEVECSEFCANCKFYLLVTNFSMTRDKKLLLFIGWKIIVSIWLFFIQSKMGSCLLNGMKKEWYRFITLAFWQEEAAIERCSTKIVILQKAIFLFEKYLWRCSFVVNLQVHSLEFYWNKTPSLLFLIVRDHKQGRTR